MWKKWDDCIRNGDAVKYIPLYKSNPKQDQMYVVYNNSKEEQFEPRFRH